MGTHARPDDVYERIVTIFSRTLTFLNFILVIVVFDWLK